MSPHLLFMNGRKDKRCPGEGALQPRVLHLVEAIMTDGGIVVTMEASETLSDCFGKAKSCAGQM